MGHSYKGQSCALVVPQTFAPPSIAAAGSGNVTWASVPTPTPSLYAVFDLTVSHSVPVAYVVPSTHNVSEMTVGHSVQLFPTDVAHNLNGVGSNTVTVT
jgi:hypothetical protein